MTPLHKRLALAAAVACGLALMIDEAKAQVSGGVVRIGIGTDLSGLYADVAASKAREWFDTQGVDLLIGGTNSGAALAMSKVAAEKKPYIVIGAGSARVTNEECTPYSIHYAHDTVALANGTGAAVPKAGGKSWYS